MKEYLSEFNDASVPVPEVSAELTSEKIQMEEAKE